MAAKACREKRTEGTRPRWRHPAPLTGSFTGVISALTDYGCKRMQVTEAESVVMDVLWTTHPLGADEVVAALAGREDWQEPTIKTLLNRLLNKGAIRAEKQGRRYLYSPVLEREAWVLGESQGLLERLFDGRVAPLVAHFSSQRKLSREDVIELRKLLEDLDGC